MNESVCDAFMRRTGSAYTESERKQANEAAERFFMGIEPEKLPPLSRTTTVADGMVIGPKPKRGAVLQEAITTINGERQDVYGSPESSFSLIAEYWRTYLRHKKNLEITPGDVAMMMTLFKVAREANQHKRDNIVDAAGYLGIYADMQGVE